MVFGGAFALVLNCIFCLYKKTSMFPKNWKLQTVRLINNGISTFLLVESYKFLSAGSVSLVQRTDIPFVIMLSLLYGERRSSMQFWLSIWTILMVIFLIIDARFINEEPIGFIYAFVAVLLLSLSYILVKKSADVESPYVISNVNCVGLIIVGAAVMFLKGDSWYIAPEHLWAFILIGFVLFIIYIVAMPLYKWYTAERARLPFVIGALATLTLEMIIERKWFTLSHMALAILITGMIATISLNASTPKLLHGAYGKIKRVAVRKLKRTDVLP